MYCKSPLLLASDPERRNVLTVVTRGGDTLHGYSIRVVSVPTVMRDGRAVLVQVNTPTGGEVLLADFNDALRFIERKEKIL